MSRPGSDSGVKDIIGTSGNRAITRPGENGVKSRAWFSLAGSGDWSGASALVEEPGAALVVDCGIMEVEIGYVRRVRSCGVQLVPTSLGVAAILVLAGCAVDQAPADGSGLPASSSTSVTPDEEESGSPRGLGEYDQAVERLEQVVESEDDWLVYNVHIPTDSGGDITWWLPPCDPATGKPRRLTATAFVPHDAVPADTGETLDKYVVETYEVECVPPAPEIDVPPRTIITDVDVVPVWDSLGPVGSDRKRVWAHDPDVDQIRLTDPLDGTEHVLRSNRDKASGKCVDSISWSAEWHTTHVVARSGSCASSLGALPDIVTALLADASTEPVALNRRDVTIPASPTVDGLKEQVNDALAAAGWEELSTGALAQWRGPCYDVGVLEERSIATVRGSASDIELDIGMRSEACTS